MNSIITQIASALKKSGHGPSWLAREIGESPAKVSNWLHGRHEPPLERIESMCRALNIKTLRVA